MKMTIKKLARILRSRLARNIYLWIFLFYTVIQMNISNEKAFHYGIITSAWYYPFLIASSLLQMALLYVNNLVLAPYFLTRKKYFLYLLSASVLIITISLCYTIGVKIAAPYLDVDHMQHIGFVSTPTLKGWDMDSIFRNTVTYIFGNALWVVIFTMAWYMNDYYKQQQLAEEAQRKQTETELNFLKSQINPHFLFNTLNNLYGLALKQADNAPDAILKLSSILRYLLYESNVDKIDFEKEKELMQAYIELELLRLSSAKGLEFSISADGQYTIPPLLWLPVLENLFKHGTRYISEDYKGSFVFAINNSTLSISSTNYYKGAIQIADDKNVGGIGLVNLRKRLQLLYPGKHAITEHKTEDTYSITVNIENV